MDSAAALSLASNAASAAGQYSQGRITGAQYGAQADMSALQGRAQALRYRQQGNAVLRRSMEAQAMARARAAAGGADPFSGSALFAQQRSQRDASADLGLLDDNGQLALWGANSQAQMYRDAGRRARQAGLLAGVTSMGKGVADYYKLGKAPTPPLIQEMVPGQFSLVNTQYG